MMRIFQQGQLEYSSTLAALADRGDSDLAAVEPVVAKILEEVRVGGDRALIAITERVDHRRPEPLSFDRGAMEIALHAMPAAERAALEFAARRIRALHEHQRDASARFTDGDGVELGWRIRPLERVGVYAPGGKARYPSSVLMAAIPAHVAGSRTVRDLAEADARDPRGGVSRGRSQGVRPRRSGRCRRARVRDRERSARGQDRRASHFKVTNSLTRGTHHSLSARLHLKNHSPHETPG
jgi:hypothetical protein